MKHTKALTAVFGAAVAATIGFGASAETVSYKIVDETIPASLTGKPGDPANGRKVVIDRKKGNCLACHIMPIPEQQFHGETGPDLHGIGSVLNEAEMRMRLVDPKVINSETMMPSFYKTGQHRVLKDFEGKTIVSAQEVEDLIAYLLTLKE